MVLWFDGLAELARLMKDDKSCHLEQGLKIAFGLGARSSGECPLYLD